MGKITHKRSMQVIDMKMQDVEIFLATPHLLQHHDVVRQRVSDDRVEPKGNITAPHQLGSRSRIPAGKQCNLMSLANELFRQVRNDPFSAAIESGRHTFIEWGNLSDPH
jgi:hypothetical protein